MTRLPKPDVRLLPKSTGDRGFPSSSPPASSPCMLHELNSHGTCVDQEQERDVARWRKAERERLIAIRLELSTEDRSAHARALARALDALITPTQSTIVSVYWPIRAEPDLRPWMRTLCERGARVALPVALASGERLQFREWRPGAPLVRGLWKIPYPAHGADILPTVVIAPVVGFDQDCYRLGYGGGFFDRTLAVMDPMPIVIGVGYPSAAVVTIFPQPHDIPMHYIVTAAETFKRSVDR